MSFHNFRWAFQKFFLQSNYIQLALRIDIRYLFVNNAFDNQYEQSKKHS